MQIAFRQKRQELIDRGWGIDGGLLSQIGSKRAFAIASPARSDDEARFTLKTVPTLPAKPAAANGNLGNREPGE